MPLDLGNFALEASIDKLGTGGGGGGVNPLAVDITQAPYNVSTGAADNSTAINSALQTLGLLGQTCYLPPGNYNIQNPIIIGNGTSSSVSTWTAKLVGGGWPSNVSPTNSTGPTVETRLTWTGGAAAGANGMVQVLGPVLGWGLRNLRIDGGAVAANAPAWAIHTKSSARAEMEHVAVARCINGIWHDSFAVVSGVLLGTIPDDIYHMCRMISIGYIGKLNVASVGLLFDGGASGISNACFIDYNGVWFTPPSTSLGGSTSSNNIYLKKCDTIIIRNVTNDGDTGSDINHKVTYDWNHAGTTQWPKGCLIDKIDFGTVSTQAVVSTGTPAVAPSMSNNRIMNISGANLQPPNPNIPWLIWGNLGYVGLATLVAGTATVACTAAQPGSHVRVTRLAASGAPIGQVGVGVRSTGSFTVESRNADGTLCTTDTSALTWEVMTDPIY